MKCYMSSKEIKRAETSVDACEQIKEVVEINNINGHKSCCEFHVRIEQEMDTFTGINHEKICLLKENEHIITAIHKVERERYLFICSKYPDGNKKSNTFVHQ